MDKITISLDQIEALSAKALEAHGASSWVANEVALAIRTAEGKGNLICGLYYLESYCKQLVTGRLKGDVEPLVSKPRTASVFVDAQYGFAQAAFAKGFKTAIETAKECGTCSYSVAHAHTCTSLGYFTEQIAKAGYIGIGFTNASAIVSPPGGTTAVLGTNPIAMAIPSKNGGVEFQFDQSTSAVALGKITMAASSGEEIPLGWAVDANGNPTKDPKEAIKGSLVSSGGYKGWGFGLMTEVLAAAFTGSVNSLDVKGLKLPDGPPHDLGQFYFILDPKTHGDDFFDKIARFSDAVEQQEGTRLPGSNFQMPNEVSIEASVWNQLNTLGKVV